jgi:hypothetical protein
MPLVSTVSFFDSVSATERREQRITLANLERLIRATAQPTKEALPLLKFARFGELRSAAGSLRHDANVTAITGIEADYDEGLASYADAVDIIKTAGINALIYTSPRHAPDKPRWRVCCPTSRELPPHQRDQMIGRLAGLFRQHDIELDTASWALSQSYYYGTVRANGAANPNFQIEVIAGRPIDLLDELDETAATRPQPNRRRRTNGAANGNGVHAGADAGSDANRNDEDKLWRIIRRGENGEYRGDRSAAEFFVITEMLRRGYRAERIQHELTNPDNGISAKALEQGDPQGYAERQIGHGIESLAFSVADNGRPYATQDNIRIALVKLAIAVRYDQFAQRVMITGLPEFGPVVDDAAVTRLWLVLDQRFALKVGKGLLHDVIADTARLNAFHPVCDYLDSLSWDGVARIDDWLTTYGGAEASNYTRAVGGMTLVAAVRRVRQPGCKFDEMLVVETRRQGTAKSSAFAVLAVHDDWFSDDLPLNKDTKVVIESLSGRWIVEAAELSGMRRGEVEHVKALLSRRIDRARMAYGRLPIEAARQCVIVGTTNNDRYLKDTTGNRRFWPVRVRAFDLAALKRDRDQLWAEAAAREAQGESIRLDQSLWPSAAQQQQTRLVHDPFYEMLQTHLGRFAGGRITSETVWTILDLRGGQRTQDHNYRMGNAMRQLGWLRPVGGRVKIKGQLVMGYMRGDPALPRPVISASRDRDGTIRVWQEEPHRWTRNAQAYP